MALSAAEILQLLDGEASDELAAQFLAEASVPQGEVNNLLRGAEEWARTKLNAKAPSPESVAPSGEAILYLPQSLRKAALTEDSAGNESIALLLEYIRGTATPEVEAGIGAQLDDEDSFLSKLFKQLKSQEK